MTTVQRGAFTIFLGAVIAAGSFGAYKWRQARIKRSVTAPALPPNSSEALSAPPFATKEPNRYQATRTITSIDSDSAGVQTEPTVIRISIARDGDKRREDYDSDSDFRTSYLELPTGTFVLLHAKKAYAEIKPASGNPAAPSQQGGEQSDAGADFSPDILLNEATSARYEKLGNEKLDSRTVTKYRVTTGAANGTGATTVTLIWIDETLALPIKSETEVSDGTHYSKVTTELRDIQLQVDLKLFELPADFQRVDDSQLREWLKQMRR